MYVVKYVTFTFKINNPFFYIKKKQFHHHIQIYVRVYMKKKKKKGWKNPSIGLKIIEQIFVDDFVEKNKLFESNPR